MTTENVDLGSAHRPLREQVADVLRERIISGELNPGARLVERTLADQLGVSRVPVRDALNLLKGEGFVTEVPRKGVVVTELSRHDAVELFDVREALEVLAVRLATARATREELDELGEVMAEAATALRAEDVSALGRCNQAFHDRITAIAHNDLLASMLEPLEGRLHWLLRQNDQPELLHREHVALYRAIASGDAEKAESLALAHVRTSRRICLDLLYADEDAL
ncbi:MAG: GntR family transcriptional regulator [Nocardioidaceae bacterium]|nr:GntR family transcriptional regulator [Nocardioidaceae bacterium]